ALWQAARVRVPVRFDEFFQGRSHRPFKQAPIGERHLDRGARLDLANRGYSYFSHAITHSICSADRIKRQNRLIYPTRFYLQCTTELEQRAYASSASTIPLRPGAVSASVSPSRDSATGSPKIARGVPGSPASDTSMRCSFCETLHATTTV